GSWAGSPTSSSRVPSAQASISAAASSTSSIELSSTTTSSASSGHSSPRAKTHVPSRPVLVSPNGLPAPAGASPLLNTLSGPSAPGRAIPGPCAPTSRAKGGAGPPRQPPPDPPLAAQRARAPPRPALSGPGPAGQHRDPVLGHRGHRRVL